MTTAPLPVDEREIFTSGPVVVFKWRNAPGWPVEYCSRNVLDIFGHSADAFVSGSIAYSDLIHPDDLERVGGEVAHASESGAVDFTHLPYRIKRPDGQIVWLHDHTHVIRDGSGAVTHYHGYVFDVTAQVEAEEANRSLQQQLLDTQKLESLGLLAGGLAHDFNNVLTGILGHANLARRALERGATEESLESIGQIEGLSLKVAELCNQLLAYSGRGRFVVQPLDLASVVRELAGMFQVAISKKAALELELAEDVPAVSGDQTQIQQILMNLITNASESLGDEPGRITVRLRLRDCDADALSDLVSGSTQLDPGTYVSLSVEDTGSGMNPETRARLFDPFYTTKFTGRGLGLAAALGIMRGHQGAIRLRSEAGQGSCFELLLPPSDGTPAAAQPPAPTPPGEGGQGLVLLVDDEPVVRKVGTKMLELLGYEVREAGDGDQALERLRGPDGEAFRFVLLDLTMPTLSGAETLQELRKLHPQLPVILSSGFNQEEAFDPESGPALVEFLQKPYRLDDLSAAIGRLGLSSETPRP
jgi:PAS domain S-box-containing protein